MSDPIPERIAAVIVTRLENITTANGYQITVDDVVRPDRQAVDYTPKNYLILVEQSDDVPVPELDIPGNPPAIASAVTFNIIGLNRQSDRPGTPTPVSTGDNKLSASIRKAICNAADWHHFDNLSLNAAFGVAQPVSSQTGDHAGITIPLVVTYRYSETDPYTVRR